jgi:glucose-6-phosphate 1-dehydrogenase
MDKPLTLVIFGATGDLYARKLCKSLLDLYQDGHLPNGTRIVGFGRRPLTTKDFRTLTHEALAKTGTKESSEKLELFLSQVDYVSGDFNSPNDFQKLQTYLRTHDTQVGVCTNKLYYLAVPPNLYRVILQNIATSGLMLSCATGSTEEAETWTRVLIEKPFGTDLVEAKSLDTLLGTLFDESQIFRIDHYLAKETIQNILTFRFSNRVFESLWNHKDVQQVKIVLHEKKTIGTRGDFYNDVGALRDVGQNHMLQMLAMVAMEDPGAMTPKAIHESRANVLERVVCMNSPVRGQYSGYQEALQNADPSSIETFFRVTLGVDNPRWSGVPFILESGKALAEDRIAIEIHFQPSSRSCAVGDTTNCQNVLTFTLQPTDSIGFRFWFKCPGFDTLLEPKELAFSYPVATENLRVRDAYERVLYDCIRGDQTLFTTTREVLAQWRVVEELLWQFPTVPLVPYAPGTSGADIH